MFEPERSITRAEFVTLLIRAMGLSPDNSGNKFKDVDADAWYAAFVNAAQKAGLVDGFEDGTFRPNDPITREQIVVFLYRAIQKIGKPIGEAEEIPDQYSDRDDVSDWAKTAFARLIEAGIVKGMSDTELAPSESTTRAQTAVLLHRVLLFVEYINEL